MSSPPDLASLERLRAEREKAASLPKIAANAGTSSRERMPGSSLEAHPSQGASAAVWKNRLRPFTVVRGSSAIVAYQGALERLAERCGQGGTMVHLPYFLLPCRLGAKVPHLLVRQDAEGELECAVLLNQYMIYGVPTGLFIPIDLAAPQSVLAPPGARSGVAEQAAAFLLHGLGSVVLLSLRDGDFSKLQEHRLGSFAWTAQTRTVVQTLPLQETLDATLATLGSHTRRNLRHFRRRVVAEMSARFESEENLTEETLHAINRHTLYPVPKDVVTCRVTSVRLVPGSFVVGLRARDGAWLSMIGGRRYDGATTVDWQMNTDVLWPTFSLGTAMRAFLLEDEIARGTRCLSFDGGTSHPMHRSFLPETVSDLLLTRWFLPLKLLRRFVPPRLPDGVLLTKMLESASLVWRRSRG